MKMNRQITLLVAMLMILLPVPLFSQSTAYVSTYGELSTAIANASVNNIVVTANIDVPCETSVTSTSNPNYTGSATAQLVIGRSLTLQSQAGSKYTIKRIAANGATTDRLKSLISIRGDGNGTSGTANLTENRVEVTFTNIIIDGGANWESSTVCERRTAATTAYGNAGRAMIDVFMGGTLNLEDGVVLQNGFTTYSINSVVNNSGSANYGGAVRVEYHANYGGGTVNVKAGAIIHDCTASGYGGALGAYNFARLNLYGGTIYNCSSENGGAIATTYRSGSDKTKSGTVKMYGGTIHDCCASKGGAISMDGEVSNFLLGGTIENCSASTKGAAICINESGTTVNIVAYTSHLLTITNCTGGESTNIGGYVGVYKHPDAIITDFPVYHVTFQNNNNTFAVLSVAQGTSLGEAFPAAPVNAGLRFLGWYNGNTQVTSSTAINDNITVTAKWDFFGSGTSANPYQIPSVEAWNFLADNVNNGNTYSEKCFQLTNNISVTTMVGTNNGSKPFGATFDGNGKTLNVSIEGSGECTAAFGALNGATIKNLHITGIISTDGVRPASIAGFISGNSTITNCWSEVSINSSQVNYWVDAGAFVARVNNGNTLTLRGCLFTGSITYSDKDAYEGGGMVGWAQPNTTVKFYDCVFAPSAITITKNQDQYTFVSSYDGYTTRTIENCYYNDVANSNNYTKEGNHWQSITAGTNVTITNLGAATASYNVSGITAYSHGIKCNDIYYAGSGEAVSLNLGYTPHSGYSFRSYYATAGTLTGSDNSYSLAMPAANVTINARYSISKSISAYTPNGHDGWYLISSPIGTVNPANVTNMTSNTYDIFRFNQNPPATTTQQGTVYLELENWADHEPGETEPRHFDLVPGRGYLYANNTDVTLTFIGTPYSGDGVVNLEYSTANPDSRMHGWNLIGNPFGVAATVDKASLKMNPAGDGFVSQVEGASVAAMEGVFVQATATGQSATFTVPTRGSEKAVVARTNIMVSGDKGKILDNAIIRFDDGEALGKFQLRESSTKVYIPVDGKDYAIANADNQSEIPVNFRAEKNGSYTLSFSNENIDFGYLHLIDNMTGADIDLLAQPSYTFTSRTTDYESRFRLVFNDNDNENENFAYTGNDGQLIISGSGTIQMFDLMGRVISIRSTEERIQTKGMTPGVYILQLITESDVKTQKIMINLLK